MSFIIELAVDLVGAIVESSLVNFSPKSRVEKIFEKLKSFQGKAVIIQAGTVLSSDKFRVDETFEIPKLKLELSEKNLLLYLSETEPPLVIEWKKLSRFYTGKKGSSRFCINTQNTDYLIDLINANSTT